MYLVFNGYTRISTIGIETGAVNYTLSLFFHFRRCFGDEMCTSGEKIGSKKTVMHTLTMKK